jgi:hypothetical protein
MAVIGEISSIFDVGRGLVLVRRAGRMGMAIPGSIYSSARR